MTSTMPLLAALEPASRVRVRARAEAAEWVAVLAFRDAEVTRIDVMDVSGMRKQLDRAAIVVEAGVHLGLSAMQVSVRLVQAGRLRDHTPTIWSAFGDGVIDAARAVEVAKAAGRLERPESCALLDAKVLAYATCHTVAELRAWLRRFVVRVESDLAIERANAEREKRYVDVTPAEDGMAWLNAYLPAHEAAAMATRLRRAAQAARVEGDERTQAQLQADLLVAWTLTADDSVEARGRGMAIDIGVLINADALAGGGDGHAAAADGSWEVPTEWLLTSALAGDAFWHRFLTDPFTGNTLAHDYRGYQPPNILRRAITLRDGTCAATGCLTPADRCQLDHRQPWPEGPTSGTNLEPRCQRDHALKGHGIWDDIRARHNQINAHRPPDDHPWPTG